MDRDGGTEVFAGLMSNKEIRGCLGCLSISGKEALWVNQSIAEVDARRGTYPSSRQVRLDLNGARAPPLYASSQTGLVPLYALRPDAFSALDVTDPHFTFHGNQRWPLFATASHIHPSCARTNLRRPNNPASRTPIVAIQDIDPGSTAFRLGRSHEVSCSPSTQTSPLHQRKDSV